MICKMQRKELDLIPEVLPQEMRKLCPKKITKELFLEHWSVEAVFPNLIAQSTAINGECGKEYKTVVSLGPLMPAPSSQSGHEFGGDQMQQMLGSCKGMSFLLPYLQTILDIYIYIYITIYTYIHTYVRTYIHTYIHTSMLSVLWRLKHRRAQDGRLPGPGRRSSLHRLWVHEGLGV